LKKRICRRKPEQHGREPDYEHPQLDDKRRSITQQSSLSTTSFASIRQLVRHEYQPAAETTMTPFVAEASFLQLYSTILIIH
jgi:hypothetical protein